MTEPYTPAEQDRRRAYLDALNHPEAKFTVQTWTEMLEAVLAVANAERTRLLRDAARDLPWTYHQSAGLPDHAVRLARWLRTRADEEDERPGIYADPPSISAADVRRGTVQVHVFNSQGEEQPLSALLDVLSVVREPDPEPADKPEPEPERARGTPWYEGLMDVGRGMLAGTLNAEQVQRALLRLAGEPDVPGCDTCRPGGTPGYVREEYQQGTPGVGGWLTCPDCGPRPSVRQDDDFEPERMCPLCGRARDDDVVRLPRGIAIGLCPHAFHWPDKDEEADRG